MCGRGAVVGLKRMLKNHPTGRTVRDYIQDVIKDRFNLCPTQSTGVLSREGEDLAARLMRWGIVGIKGMHPNTKADAARASRPARIMGHLVPPWYS